MWSGPVQVVSMSFDEVGAPARLSGGPFPATTFQWSILYLWQYSELLI